MSNSTPSIEASAPKQPLWDTVTRPLSLLTRLLPGSLRLSVARVQLGLGDLRAAFRTPQRATAWRATRASTAARVETPRRKPRLTPEQIAERVRAGQERKRARLTSLSQEWPTAPAGLKHQVRYARSGTLLAVDDDRSLLQAGLDAGLELTFSCGLGGCGACKSRLVSGEVELQEPNCLSDDERAEGYILPCVTRPLGNVELEA